MAREIEGSKSAQRAIAPESPAVQRARRKAQNEPSVDATALRTEQAANAIRAIHARYGHSPREEIRGRIHRESSSPEIKKLRNKIAGNSDTPKQREIDEVAQRLLLGN